MNSVTARIVDSAEEIAARARSLTGIDIVDEGALEPLRVLLRSLNEDSDLHPQGAKALEQRLLRIMSNRLRMQRDYARHPEIAAQKLEAPIFICGSGRTGSTKAQKLLAASGDFNWLPYWQALNPSLNTGVRTESVQPRIDDTDQFVRWFDAASPEVKYAHPFETYEPEEDSAILEHSLKSPVWMGWSPLNGYLSWLASQDMSAQFLYLRDTLKYLQWQGLTDESKRWMLKCPLYMGLEPELLSVFPDAYLVMPHRHPAGSIPSGIRLLQLFYKPYTDRDVDAELYIAGQVGIMSAHLRNRATINGSRLIDIDFRELMSQPARVIEKLYRFCGVPLTEPSLERMLAWNDQNPQHKKGKHAYRLEDYHLTERKIDLLFADYIGFLKTKFGP